MQGEKMKLSERRKLELIQNIADNCYIDTGDKWWMDLSKDIDNKLKFGTLRGGVRWWTK